MLKYVHVAVQFTVSEILVETNDVEMIIDFDVDDVMLMLLFKYRRRTKI